MNRSTRLDTIPTSQLATTTGGFLLTGGPVAQGINATPFSVTKAGSPSGSKAGAPSGSKTRAPSVTSKPSAPPLVPVVLQDADR